MLNRIISSASSSHGNTLEMSFARNDPTIILGSAASRKPDTFGGDKEAFVRQSRAVEAMAAKGPSGNALHWSEIFTFIEFKLRHHSLLSAPAATTSSSGGRRPKSTSTSRTRGAGDISPSGAPPAKRARINGGTPATPGPASATRSKSKSASGTNPPPPPAGTKRSNTKRSTSKVTSGTPATSLVPSRTSNKGSGVGASGGSKAQTTSTTLKETPETQCASYALELLSHGGLRTHVIAALVTDDSIELLYYDRSIIIKSEPFNFITDQKQFVAWVIGMIRLDSAGWGFDPVVPHVRRYTDITATGKISKSLYNDSGMKLGPGWELRIKGTIFNAHCIIGRGTAVFLAEVEGTPKGRELSKKKTVIVKLSNPAKSRLSEIEAVTTAHRQAASDERTKKFLKNLPLIIDYEDRAAGRVQMALLGHFKDLYELRVPRAIIMEQLFPITELVDAASAAPVYRDIVECYRWLFDECRIRHSDISINNLMYRREGGHNHGVLNDFDLVGRRGDFTGPQSRQRTGTKQFMAYDLLNPHKSHSHFYRHDLESILYVMVFHFCGHRQGQEIPFSLQDWSEISGGALWHRKLTFLNDIPPSTTDQVRSTHEVCDLHRAQRP
ncbi:hypothetical protein BD779DRAFT_228936 [Infundibulicybe gibba]|nr:hypothetical protein BD779DRAFT_228936 [Infundibulicybe gibba]